jgi:hypothetical protein
MKEFLKAGSRFSKATGFEHFLAEFFIKFPATFGNLLKLILMSFRHLNVITKPALNKFGRNL